MVLADVLVLFWTIIYFVAICRDDMDYSIQSNRMVILQVIFIACLLFLFIFSTAKIFILSVTEPHNSMLNEPWFVLAYLMFYAQLGGIVMLSKMRPTWKMFKDLNMDISKDLPVDRQIRGKDLKFNS